MVLFLDNLSFLIRNTICLVVISFWWYYIDIIPFLAFLCHCFPWIIFHAFHPSHPFTGSIEISNNVALSSCTVVNLCPRIQLQLLDHGSEWALRHGNHYHYSLLTLTEGNPSKKLPLNQPLSGSVTVTKHSSYYSSYWEKLRETLNHIHIWHISPSVISKELHKLQGSQSWAKKASSPIFSGIKWFPHVAKYTNVSITL